MIVDVVSHGSGVYKVAPLSVCVCKCDEMVHACLQGIYLYFSHSLSLGLASISIILVTILLCTINIGRHTCK
jgi:hypothetical protein